MCRGRKMFLARAGLPGFPSPRAVAGGTDGAATRVPCAGPRRRDESRFARQRRRRRVDAGFEARKELLKVRTSGPHRDPAERRRVQPADREARLRRRPTAIQGEAGLIGDGGARSQQGPPRSGAGRPVRRTLFRGPLGGPGANLKPVEETGGGQVSRRHVAGAAHHGASDTRVSEKTPPMTRAVKSGAVQFAPYAPDLEAGGVKAMVDFEEAAAADARPLARPETEPLAMSYGATTSDAPATETPRLMRRGSWTPRSASPCIALRSG